jgi:hypothetical protein
MYNCHFSGFFRYILRSHIVNGSVTSDLKTFKLRGLSPRANYTDRATVNVCGEIGVARSTLQIPMAVFSLF